VARTMHGAEQAAQLKPIADGPQEAPNLASAESEGFSGIEPVGREADLQKPASHSASAERLAQPRASFEPRATGLHCLGHR
jgi:hypothetical protein